MFLLYSHSFPTRRSSDLNYDGKLMSIPPVFAASALYDNLLQAALRQFFGRATFETEAIPSLSSDGRLAIEPTSDPSELTIRSEEHTSELQSRLHIVCRLL